MTTEGCLILALWNARCRIPATLEDDAFLWLIQYIYFDANHLLYIQKAYIYDNPWLFTCNLALLGEWDDNTRGAPSGIIFTRGSSRLLQSLFCTSYKQSVIFPSILHTKFPVRDFASAREERACLCIKIYLCLSVHVWTIYTRIWKLCKALVKLSISDLEEHVTSSSQMLRKQ